MATPMMPLGLVLPIRDGNNGFFEQAYDTFTQKRMNLINMLRTRPGERRFQPLFGCRLWTTLFEQNADILPEVITNIVKEDTARWIDGVIILKVLVQTPSSNPTATDIYQLLVSVTFEDTATQQTGTVEILINSGKV